MINKLLLTVILLNGFMLSTSTVYSANPTIGDLLLEINNPTPETGEFFGISIASTPDGNIIVGATGALVDNTKVGAAYLFDVTSIVLN